MKKFKSIIALMGLVAVVVVPVVVLAQQYATQCIMRGVIPPGVLGTITCPAVGDPCDFATNVNCGMCCTIGSIYFFTNLIFVGVVALAVFFILIAAYNFLSASGDPAKVTIARQMLMYAAIGIIIAFVAKWLPSLVKALFFGQV